MQGVNRALPYVASSEVDDIVEVQTPILFRLVSLLADKCTLTSFCLKDIELSVRTISDKKIACRCTLRTSMLVFSL
jgi:hypothetical protein